MFGFIEAYFLFFGTFAILGAAAAIYFYLQDRKESML